MFKLAEAVRLPKVAVHANDCPDRSHRESRRFTLTRSRSQNEFRLFEAIVND
jgi:hypothetical protein